MNAPPWTARPVSVVRHARDVQTHPRTVGELLVGIRAGKWKTTVEKVRAIVAAEGRDAAKPTKETLPAVLWSGTFTTRANGNLREHSGVLCLDFDKLGDKLPEARAAVEADPHTAAVFCSPSGDGLKVLVCIPADAATHRAAYETAAAHFAGLGLQADTAPRAVASLCFVSYDPELFTRDNPEPFTPAAEETRKPSRLPEPTFKPGDLTPWADFAQRTTWAAILGPHGWTQGHTKGDGNTEWTRPGKGEGTSATTKGEDGPMFVFSSNAAPLPPNEGISKSYAFALLNHAGDMKAAARALRADGYGGATNGDPEAWGELLPFDAAEYGPTLPPEVLPKVLRDFVATVAESKQVPPELPALLALGAVAAAGAKRYEVHVGRTHREPLNLYGLAAMDTGERKSPTAAAVFAPLEEYQARLAEAAAPEIAKATEARELDAARLVELRRRAAKEENPSERSRLKDEALDLAATMTEVRPAPRLLCGDVTPEALAVLLDQQQGRVLQYDTEGGAFFSIIGGGYSKTGATSVDVHLKAYTGDPIRFDRTTRGAVTVARPALTLMLATQPDQLRKVQRADELKGRGLLARFAFVMPAPMVGRRSFEDKPMDHAAAAAFGDLVKKLLAVEPLANDEARPLTITGEAWGVWRDYAQQVERELGAGGALHDLRDWCAKAPGLVARLAGVLHLAAGGTTGAISPATVAAAVVCAECFTQHARAVFALMSGAKDEMARRVLEWIARHRLTRFTMSQCFDTLRRGMGDGAATSDLERPLAILESRNYIRPAAEQPRRAGKKPSPSFEVNPAAFEVCHE